VIMRSVPGSEEREDKECAEQPRKDHGRHDVKSSEFLGPGSDLDLFTDGLRVNLVTKLAAPDERAYRRGTGSTSEARSDRRGI
jgi:hypothetical protein